MSRHVINLAMVTCTPMPYVKKPGGLLGLDDITVDWHRAKGNLAIPTNFHQAEMVVDGMEIGEARELVARKIVKNDPQPEFLFFLDSDVIVPYDALTKLFYRAKHFPDYDIFCGVYCLKNKSVSDPLIYSGDGNGPFWDWTIGDILTTDDHNITSCHMGLTMIRTSLFNKMIEKGDLKHGKMFHTTKLEPKIVDGVMQRDRGTEDIFFCKQAIKIGAKILVDTSVLAAHMDKTTGVKYGLPEDCDPVKRAVWLQHNKDKNPKLKDEKKALDIGSGGRKRNWEGYKTYSTDIRPGIGVDFVQDTRKLNMPHNEWDMVASSHHLEHIGRWEQEAVWEEMFNILKPGGIMEHIVPDISWAAQHIANKDSNNMGHVLNVLYGAQESHGYDRNFNTHYFGYTKEIAEGLAKSCGLVDVITENWKDNDELGYNLIIRGRKPTKKDVLVQDKEEVVGDIENLK